MQPRLKKENKHSPPQSSMVITELLKMSMIRNAGLFMIMNTMPHFICTYSKGGGGRGWERVRGRRRGGEGWQGSGLGKGRRVEKGEGGWERGRGRGGKWGGEGGKRCGKGTGREAGKGGGEGCGKVVREGGWERGRGAGKGAGKAAGKAGGKGEGGGKIAVKGR